MVLMSDTCDCGRTLTDADREACELFEYEIGVEVCGACLYHILTAQVEVESLMLS
jgi:hypothetical protein